MSRYLAQRLLGAIPTLIGISLLTFLFIRLIPGDAIAARLGTSTALTPEQLASLRAYFGLDQPLLVQYWTWLSSLLRGDAGYSIRTGRPVLVEITERLPATLELSAAAALIAIALGIPLGLLSAVRSRSRLDVAARIGGLIGLSLPSFWLGTLIIVLFSLYLRVVVTLLGIQVGQLLGGAVVVEEIFSVPGVGRMLLTAIVQRDYALVQGGVLAIAILFVALNIVVDLLYGYLDPRIRLA
ncbi:MAG: ABC transporter permease [Chloroflexi bacterium]|nr:MAG: ABC transporter permease [Chloroflexota bacterium]